MPAPYRFGRIDVRPDQRQLLIDGQPAPLGARAFDLLLALIAHRDRLVSKNELLDLVWPGLVVEENNLQVQVSTLRKLLGPQAIATIPGRGYRFTLVGDEPAAVPAGESAPAVPATPGADRVAERQPPVLGRDDDLRALLDLLHHHPLVTLVGPGGIGKTTLARWVAQAAPTAWPDGCAWVELASLDEARLVTGSIAQALDLQLAPGADALSSLVNALKAQRILLVLDNAEQVVDGLAAIVQALLRGAPGVHLLVTSQIPLKVHDEQVLRLEALAVPASLTPVDEAARHGAVALFAERARAADRRFVLRDDNVEQVIDICRRLDGLPLALELAAARVPLLGARGVADRLDDRFRLLAGGSRSSPSRQQTLQAALEWSLALLPEADRQLFQHLAVFAGGFPLELAQSALVDARRDEWALIDGLAALVDHSLLNTSPSEPLRYALSETARAYALAGLSADTRFAELRGAHARALRRFFDASPDDWRHMSDADWLARYEPELDNLRAALAWADAEQQGETVVALVGAAAPLWHHLSLHHEAREWHDRSEPLVTAGIPPALAARWWRAAQWAWAPVSPERSRKAAEHAHALYRTLGDAHGLYAQLTGLAGMWNEPNAEARAALEEARSLERPDWPARERAWGFRALADVARAESRLEDSRTARLAELALRAEAGDERGRLRAMAHLAELSLAMGHAQAAEDQSRVLVALQRTRRSVDDLRAALGTLALSLRAQGREPEARAAEREAAELTAPHGAPA